MLGRTVDLSRATAATTFKLTPKMRYLVLILLLKLQMRLLHRVDLLPDQLHLIDLLLNLMLIILTGAHLALELCPDLVEQLVQTATTIAGRAHAPVLRVHRHDGKKC